MVASWSCSELLLNLRNCLPLGKWNWCHEVSGNSISTIVIGGRDLHCHSTYSRCGGVNSMCTMNYVQMMKRGEKSWMEEIMMSYFTWLKHCLHISAMSVVSKENVLQCIAAYVVIAWLGSSKNCWRYPACLSQCMFQPNCDNMHRSP